jgi:mono/diheme cytochrome c family protein
MMGRKASELFAARCARCHDDNGTGKALRQLTPALPDFSSVRWHRQRSNAQLVVSILEGRGTQMPAFADRVTTGEARDLAEYVRTFAGYSGAGEKSEADVYERFRELQEEYERLRKQFYDLQWKK